jgi:hypothetical protein
VTEITPEQLKNAATDETDDAFDWGDRRQEEVTRRYSRYSGY